MIDKATVAKIIDAADIVEVVSDFVSLRRRGANYIGLCPFHNEKTPSFSVSKAKGICHCFSCGKGGSPVNFIMEHEQLSYYEALKYLAKKYHIEVVEKELTDEERAAQSEREGMLIVNEFACTHFEQNLFNTQDGQDIGMSYLNERGFNENIIKKFRLGYSMDNNNVLFNEAVSKGYNKQYLFDTGLCIDDKRGGGYDRFKGRIVFPIFNVAGKVIAFSARTLKNDQAKYVNSPESIIYKKSNELFGLYQAKQAIVKSNKCFLVEGNADVVSMHQAGIENTIASLGTALTANQVRMIHRFTENITVIYDGDAAGIKAALRAINILLPEGLNIRILLLPDGDDPDSYSKKHSSSEFQEYIEKNEMDFIRFMKMMLLDNVKDDPIKRAAVIGDVVTSIALIPFDIQRSVYTKECSDLFNIDEKVLTREISKKIAQNRQKAFEEKQKKASTESESETISEEVKKGPSPTVIFTEKANKIGNAEESHNSILYPYEKDIIKYLVKYGMLDFCSSDPNSNDDEDSAQISLLSYISHELEIDNINFSNKDFDKIYRICQSYETEYHNELNELQNKCEIEAERTRIDGIKEIQSSLQNIQDVELREKELNEKIKNQKNKKINDFQMYFLEKKLSSHPDNDVRRITLELVSEKHHLSKIHTRYANIKSDADQLFNLIPKALLNWKDAIILCQIKDNQKILTLTEDMNKAEELLKRIQELYKLRKDLAEYLGDRVVNPKN